MSRAGVGVLERIHSRFNARQHVHILENVMVSSVRLWNPLAFQVHDLNVIEHMWA